MFLNLKKIQRIILSSETTIYEVIKNLSDSGLRIVLVEDSNKKFLGVLNDGDIRRAFLRGGGLNTTIEKFVNKKSIHINQKYEKNLKKLNTLKKFNEPIPVIKNKKIFGLITFRKMRSKINKNYTLTNTGLVIMAGGFGTRLYPLTKKTPKGLLKYKSKTLLEHVINNASIYGIKNLYLSIYYMKNKIKRFFKNKKFLNKQISFLEEKKPLGTIGSLSLIKNISNNFIVLNCDVISNVDLRDLYTSHIKSGCLMTLSIKKIKLKNPYGTIISKGKNLISIKEKPDQNFDINAGVYVFNKKIIKIIKKKKFKKIDELIQYLVTKKSKINIFHMVEKWQDFGQDIETLKRYNS